MDKFPVLQRFKVRGFNYYSFGIFILILIASLYFSGRYMFRLQWSRTVPRGSKSNNATTDGTKKIRIFCLILTAASRTNQTNAVNKTWAKRCDEHLFLIGQSKHVIQKDMLNLTVREGKRHLTAKVRAAFKYVYKSYSSSYDWFLKCDDDSFIIMENLRYLLSHLDPKKPAYLGLAMKTRKHPHHGYMTGAGYVISSDALSRLVHIGFESHRCKMDGISEDVNTGCALDKSGVPMINTVDTRGQESFHHLSLERYQNTPHAEKLSKQTWNQVLKSGPECCSIYTICFHGVKPEQQFLFEHLLYNTVVFGLNAEKVENDTIFESGLLAKRYWNYRTRGRTRGRHKHFEDSQRSFRHI